jgi:hypothetical protein
MRVVVLIPAHNEEERVAATVRAAAAIPGVTRVVVVDDGSVDATAHLAETAGADVIRLPENRGKGAALEVGAKAVADADVVLLLDADLGETAEQGALLLAPVLAGDADMVIATFPPPEGKAGFGLVKNLARWGIRALCTREFEASAPLSGQRAMTRTCLAAVRPFSSGYGAEVGITVRALRANQRVVEVGTTMAHAATGRDVAGFAHRGRQFVHVAAALAKLALQRRPR